MGSLINARAHNVDLKIHAGGAIYRSNIPNGNVMLVVAPDSPIRAAKDLSGKTICVPSLGDQNMLATKAWVDTQGGDSRSLTFVEVPSSAAAAAVGQGRVAAAVVVPPFVARAVADGTVRILAQVFSAIAPRFLETGFFTTADFAAKHRDLVVRFGKIIADASLYVNAHTAEIADLLGPFSGIPAAAIVAAGISPCATSLDARDIQPLIDVSAKYGIIDHRFDAADFLFK
jgi:NitT/TauT family transport system substrate-binding protein